MATDEELDAAGLDRRPRATCSPPIDVDDDPEMAALVKRACDEQRAEMRHDIAASLTDEELAEAGLVRESAYRQACEDDLSRALGIRSGGGWRNLLQGVAALRCENARFQDTLNTEHGHASAAMSRIESALSGGAS